MIWLKHPVSLDFLSLDSPANSSPGSKWGTPFAGQSLFMIVVTIFSSYLWVWFRDTVCLIARINASVSYKQPNLAIGSLGKSKVRGTRRRLYSVCSANMTCVMVRCWIFIYWSVFQLRTLTSLEAPKIKDVLCLDPLT